MPGNPSTCRSGIACNTCNKIVPCPGPWRPSAQSRGVRVSSQLQHRGEVYGWGSTSVFSLEWLLSPNTMLHAKRQSAKVWHMAVRLVVVEGALQTILITKRRKVCDVKECSCVFFHHVASSTEPRKDLFTWQERRARAQSPKQSPKPSLRGGRSLAWRTEGFLAWPKGGTATGGFLFSRFSGAFRGEAILTCPAKRRFSNAESTELC